MRYQKQSRHDNCGVYVLKNAAIWTGTKDIDLAGLKYKKGIGVAPNHFKQFLKKSKNLPFKYKKTISMPTIQEIRQNISDNKCIILGVSYGYYSHIGLITEITKHYVTVVNWSSKGPAVKRFHINTLRGWLKRWSVAYCIQKS